MTEWMAYYQVEPFGSDYLNLLASHIVAAIYNVNRDTKEHPKPFSPADFLLKFQEATEEDKDPADVYDMFRTWALLSGAKHNGNA